MYTAKQGMLKFSNETIIDSSVMWNPDTYDTFPSPRKRHIYKPTGEWIERFALNSRIIGSYNAHGKHGTWKLYNAGGELDKIQTYENGNLVKEEFLNYLNYKSIEKLQETIVRTWSKNRNIFSANFKERSSTYTFESDGTLIYRFRRMVDGEDTGYIRKGTWKIINFNTVELTIYNKTRTFNLEYLSNQRIRFKKQER